MRLSALAFQATLVVGVTATVGYPEFRQPHRPVDVWRTNGPLTPRPGLVASDRRLAFVTVATDGSAATVDSRGRRVVADPRRVQDAGRAARTIAISGRARTAFDQPVGGASLALRNVRSGRIVSRILADQLGLFDFGTHASSSYIVEMLGADGAVIAASELIGAGTLAGTVTVRLNGNLTPRALFGVPDGATSFFASTASEPLGLAIASGVQQTLRPAEAASPRR